MFFFTTRECSTDLQFRWVSFSLWKFWNTLECVFWLTGKRVAGNFFFKLLQLWTPNSTFMPAFSSVLSDLKFLWNIATTRHPLRIKRREVRLFRQEFHLALQCTAASHRQNVTKLNWSIWLWQSDHWVFYKTSNWAHQMFVLFEHQRISGHSPWFVYEQL